MVAEPAIGPVVGGGLLLAVSSARCIPAIDQRFTRLALRLFRRPVETAGRRRRERQQALRATRTPVSYPVFASRTLLYSAVIGIAGSLVAVGVVQHVLVRVFANGAPGAVGSPGLPVEVAGWRPIWLVFGVFVVSTSAVGFGGAGLTYAYRWNRIERLAEKRARRIDASLPRTIAFVYALSRSGMAVPDVLRTAANQASLGQSGEEIAVIVTQMEVFGVDLVTALARATNRTPSETFAGFTENFRSVLQSGRAVSEYLREQYERQHADRVQDQEQVLEILNALAEGYVAGLVAGPLFVITILVVVGLLVDGFLGVLQLVVYLALPLANAGFMAYLARFAASLQPGERSDLRHDVGAGESVRQVRGATTTPAQRETVARPVQRVAKTHWAAGMGRARRLTSWPADPLDTVIQSPGTICYLSGPLGLFVLVGAGFPMLTGTAPISIAAIDDVLVATGLVVAAPYAAIRYVHTRRLRRIEAAIPDLLDRLASTNEAGMTFTESLRRVDRSDLGALDAEVGRLLADITWGARTEQALHRFSARLGSPSISRMTALVTNAMRASGHLGPVLRIAADEARGRRRLQKTRRQEMVLYVVVIYLAFLVFLGIAATLQTVLIPAIPASETIDAIARSSARVGVGLPGSRSIGPTRAAYTLVLFHAAVIQATVSGFVAGHMGEGNPLDGTKHAVVMVTLAYAAFQLLG